MVTPEIEMFTGKHRDGSFNIIASVDANAAMQLEITVIKLARIYRGQFSDAALSKLCISADTHRTIVEWFSGLKIFTHGDDGSIVVFLMSGEVIKIIVTLHPINLNDHDILDANLTHENNVIDIQKITIKQLSSVIAKYSDLVERQELRISDLENKNARPGSAKRRRKTKTSISTSADIQTRHSSSDCEFI